MAFLDSTPFVKETFQVEYSGGGDIRNYRNRITILVQYPCDADGQDGETIPTTRATTVVNPSTTCDLQRVDTDVQHGSLAGICSIIYESVTSWTPVS